MPGLMAIGKRTLAACLVATLLAAARPVQAQDPGRSAGTGAAPRISVFGGIGYNSQWDDESRLGQSYAASGGVGYRLTSRLWVEGLVNRLEHRRDLVYFAVTNDAAGNPIATPAPATLRGSATYLMGQVRYLFSTSRVQPYVAGGLGVMHYSGNGWGAVFPAVEGQPRAASGVSTTSRAMSGSGGLDIRLTGRTTIGPYVGVLLSNAGETGTKNALHGGVRLTVGW